MLAHTLIRRRTVVLPLVVLLLLSLSGGLAHTPSTLAATSVENDYATCTATSDVLVTCTLKAVPNQTSLNLVTDILPLANQVNTAVNPNTAMWVQAWGGAGGEGQQFGLEHGGHGGSGGFAQTITTINDYQARYGTTTLYYYLGDHGKTKIAFSGGGGGGAGTIVAATDHDFSTSNVLLDAGGGGGGSEANIPYVGWNGSNGGSAIATVDQSAYGAGQSASTHDGTIRGGSYNGPGLGSTSIGGDHSIVGDAGDGFGGWGGGIDVGSYFYGRAYWLNGPIPPAGIAAIGDAGHGISNHNSSGATSGGGYGGGGMDTCGGIPGVQHKNCEAAGGGSYATQSTIADGLAPTAYIAEHGVGSVQLVFDVFKGSFSFYGPSSNPFGIQPLGLSAPAYTTFADIDGDGAPDLFVGANGFVYYQHNEGTATNPQFGPLTINTQKFNFQGLSPIHPLGAPTFVDLTGDGVLDAIIGTATGATVFFQNTGTQTDPQFLQPGVVNAFGLHSLGGAAAEAAGTAWVAPTFADLNGDGLPDALIGAQAGAVWYFENVGSATNPQFGTAVAVAQVDADAVPALADIDQDGDLDLFVGGANGAIYSFLNIGSATTPNFLPAGRSLFGMTEVSADAAPAFTSFQADGTPDLFIGTSSGDIWYQAVREGSSAQLQSLDTASTQAESTESATASDYQVTSPVQIDQTTTPGLFKATIFGSHDFDPSSVRCDITWLEDWSGTQLAAPVTAFWTKADGDVNGDGYVDHTMFFYTADPAAIQAIVADGKEVFIRGVTAVGVEFGGSTFDLGPASP